MRSYFRYGLVALTGLVLATSSCAGAEDTNSPGATGSANASEAKACAGSIGLMAPITGGAASIGGEQLNFATLAVDNFNEESGSSYELVEGDTQLDPGQASTVAQQFVSNDEIFAVVGPAGSQEVEAVGDAFSGAELAFVSASATATGLTDGTYPTFFRVIPTDAVQGPTDADYMVGALGAKKVVIVEEKTSYGQGLADSVEEALKAKGASVSRIPVSQKQPDYSAVVSKVSADTDVVFATFQIAANTKVLANQLESQNKDAVLFASDGSFSEDFDASGAYVSAFAPDIKGVESSAELVQQFTDEYGEFGTFGPPVHAATQAALEAMQRACEADSLDRQGVLDEMRATDIATSILGGPLTFTEVGDVEGAKFYIFQLNDKGAPELVQ